MTTTPDEKRYNCAPLTVERLRQSADKIRENARMGLICGSWQAGIQRWAADTIEAQAAELAQARARIGRLEAGVVLAIHSLRDHWQAGGTALLVASGLQDIVNESEPQSLAAVRAEALRSAASAMQLEFDANHLFIMADRIEREAKESK